MANVAQLIVPYFHASDKFQWRVETSRPDYIHADSHLIGHYNPARSNLIQVIGEQEVRYFCNLSRYAQWQQLAQLEKQQVSTLICASDIQVPEILTRQNAINVLSSRLLDTDVITHLGNKFAHLIGPAEILQAGFLVVENQGLLITGKSGAGKSQLLLSMLDRGHHWVSDELTHCYYSQTGQVMGRALDELASFVHVKHVGPINVDKTFGLSRRLQQYPLAGIIHLGENVQIRIQQAPTYEQKLNRTILNRRFPVWQLDPEVNNLAVVIETCARQLTLDAWGQRATVELAQELDKTLCEAP